MSINAINTMHKNVLEISIASNNQEQKNIGEEANINKLNSEIKQAETEIKETLIEVQKATKDNINGASDKAQLLQSKVLMEQQTIIMKQMQIKEMMSQKNAILDVLPQNAVEPKQDQYIAKKDDANTVDNIYRLKEKNGIYQVIFNKTDKYI